MNSNCSPGRRCLVWAALTFLNFSAPAQESLPPRVNLTSPVDGTWFGSPADITLVAQTADADGYVASSPVTIIVGFGLPSVHTASWTNPAMGQYVLTVPTQLSLSQSITPPPVNITVDSPMLPVVRLETSPLEYAQAREFSPPNMDCVYPSFVVRRSGPTSTDLRAYLSYSGTATGGADDPSPLSSLVTPAGRDAAFLTLVPLDDTLVEGPEAVIAHFTALPGAGYIQDPSHLSATITITDNESPLDTIVGIDVVDPIASEISILAVIDPARFRISRTGDLSRETRVFFSVHGSATAGADYPELSSSIPIPAGESSVTLDVTPRFDQLEEGMETVLIRLEPSPLVGPMPTYDIDPARRDAVAIILDNGSSPTPELEIVMPEEGDPFADPANVEIVAAAYHPTRDISRVDFYAGADKIGQSLVVNLDPSVGGLIVHRFTWNNPPAGVHILTARGFDGNEGPLLTAEPVVITVGPEPPRPVVGIAATQPIAEEDSTPFDRLSLVGVFTISRTGPTDASLPVYVQYSGSAAPGEDYPMLPWIVSIPAGAASTEIRVVPITDNLPEGIETLVATISNCPPPGLLPPCYDFDMDPAQESATVFIRDDGLTRASLTITNPKDGANFHPGQTLLIEATAIDLDGYISRVEFFDGHQRIGESEIVFVRAPDPGTPIYHSFEWLDAAPGAHVLTASAATAAGLTVSSAPVRITVGPTSNEPPRIAITRPASGVEFPLDTPIEIVADTRDPDGYVPKVEFFADGRKIGEQITVFIQPPPPGQPQTFSFVWRQPTPGRHALTARATDDAGATSGSAPVEITVAGSEPLPIVRVTVPDSFAVEPRSNTDLNTATFRIRRFGPTNDSLGVAYSLHGTAENGVDYEWLPGLATIPAGRRAVQVIVRPLADELGEGIETLLLRLEEPPPPSPEIRVIHPYRVGHPNLGVAVISDGPWLDSPGAAECSALPGSLMHLCFAAESDHNFRIEATHDFRTWETLFDTVSSDGAWHFIDTEVENHPCRFYRLTPEPVLEVDE